jgi:site-specific DNA-methyltransferase (adenine-specific)
MTKTATRKLKTPYANLLPPLKTSEREALAADIKANGVLHPVVIDEDGNILDGHHRYAICKTAPTVEVAGLSDEEKQAYTIRANLARRNLSPDQAREVAKKQRAIAKDLRESDPKKWTQEAVGTLLGVDQATVSRWVSSDMHEHSATKTPTPDARVKLNTAAKEVVVARLEAGDTQQQIAADFGVCQKTVSNIERQAERKAEAAARQAAVAAKAAEIEGDAVDIRHIDCLQMIESLPDGSVSLLCTDPPYAVTDNEWDTFGSEQAFWDFMGSWLSAMRPKMAEQHTAFVFCDADKSPRLSYLLRDLGYDLLRQVIWYRPAIAKKRSGSLTFLSSYEPFWHCGNRSLAFPAEWGDERFDVQTFAAPQSNHVKDQSFHPTQKPLALIERLVQMGSDAGELVVDPFCGSGTTAVACAKNGRRCVTSDLNEEYIAIAKGRVASVL